MQVRYDIEIDVEARGRAQLTERIYLSAGGDFRVILDDNWMRFQEILGGRTKASDRDTVTNAARLVIGSLVEITKESEDAPGTIEEYVGRATSVQLVEVREIRERVEKISR